MKKFKHYRLICSITIIMILALLLKTSTKVSASSVVSESQSTSSGSQTSAIIMVIFGVILVVGALGSLVYRNIKNKKKAEHNNPLIEQSKKRRK